MNSKNNKQYLMYEFSFSFYNIHIQRVPSLLKYLNNIQRRQWHPTPVLLPGKSMDGGAW